MNWKEFKEKEKIWIWTGDYKDFPDGSLLLDKSDENYHKANFMTKVKVLENSGIKDYQISSLTNEDGEYAGCFIESITIQGLEISAKVNDPYEGQREDDLLSFAELIIKKKSKPQSGGGKNG